MTRTILIVEDEKSLQDVYNLVLTSKGYTVYTADNGVDGIRILKANLPDLVLLDIFMPVMDGKEFLRNIDLNDFPKTKIIVCTNISDSSTESEVLELGAHKIVLKASMTPKDLVKLVEDTLG